MNKKIFIYIIISIAILIITNSCSVGQDVIVIRDTWARPGLQGGNSAVFFTVENNSAVNDQLLSADSDIASSVEVHRTIMEDGVMKMKQQFSVPIPVNGSVIFKPGDLHIMLIDLNSDLNAGDEFDVSLQFEHAGEINLTVVVKEP